MNTTYTFVVEYPGNGPRVGLMTPMPHDGKLLTVQFNDGLKEQDRYRQALEQIAHGWSTDDPVAIAEKALKYVNVNDR